MVPNETVRLLTRQGKRAGSSICRSVERPQASSLKRPRDAVPILPDTAGHRGLSPQCDMNRKTLVASSLCSFQHIFKLDSRFLEKESLVGKKLMRPIKKGTAERCLDFSKA